MMNKRSRPFDFVLISVIFILLFAGMSACSIGDGKWNIRDNQTTGNTIIKALYLYKQEHDGFPKTLTDLMPKYLEKIPKTAGGQDFFYSANSVDGFFLSFEVDSRSGCGYTDKLQVWECSYGDGN